MMESFASRLVINSLIALFILVVPLFSGNPITWWNIGGAVAVIVVTFITRTWYPNKNKRRGDPPQ
ncbi:hypothetical protein AB0E56_02245 [Microbacterium sp. NPDC028030]|uniref:hypothetical protein n=1 Tax=Microbacterium sp. NPDC028030 TaxID=3155124 RepID=UPI0033F0EC35